METPDDESSSRIGSFPGIEVSRYRLTDFVRTPPLYIIHTTVPIFPYATILIKRVVPLISPQGRDYI
jgi:hypothetical protein